MSSEIAFVQVENEGWPAITVHHSGIGDGWRATILLDGRDLRTFGHGTPDEAVAYLERMLIQELCVPGPGATDRRAGKGRRRYDQGNEVQYYLGRRRSLETGSDDPADY